MRAVATHIYEIDERILPRVIRAFISSVPVLCNYIDDEGYFRLSDLRTSILAISAMDAFFWSSNAQERDLVVSTFPRLYSWIIIVGECVSQNRHPIQGLRKRKFALDVIHNAIWIMRDIGDSGLQFIRNCEVWRDTLSMWGRARNCTLYEESSLAAMFNHAKESFALCSQNGFLTSLLLTVGEFRMDADATVSVSLARIRRASMTGNGTDPEIGFFIYQHLFVLQVLIVDDDDEFIRGGSPFHKALFEQAGITCILECSISCISASRWMSVDICISILVAFCRGARSNAVLRSLLLDSNFIQHVMQISYYAHHLTETGRNGILFLVKSFLPEILLARSIVKLAVDLDPNLETRLHLEASEYSTEWLHLLGVHQFFLRSYLLLDRNTKRRHDECSNVSSWIF